MGGARLSETGWEIGWGCEGEVDRGRAWVASGCQQSAAGPPRARSLGGPPWGLVQEGTSGVIPEKTLKYYAIHCTFK